MPHTYTRKINQLEDEKTINTNKKKKCLPPNPTEHQCEMSQAADQRRINTPTNRRSGTHGKKQTSNTARRTCRDFPSTTTIPQQFSEQEDLTLPDLTQLPLFL